MTTSDQDDACRGVVFDLFGTLVNAPTHDDRTQAADELATAFDVATEQIHQALSASWQDRHLGLWTSLPKTVANLAELCGARSPDLALAADTVRQRARRRLECDQDVLTMLTLLTEREVPAAVLSDAAVDTAEAWPDSPLGTFNLPVFFSCRLHAVKPAPLLYQCVLTSLRLPAEQVLYCGDGGGDELAGAARAGLRPVGVLPRGGPSALAHGVRPWSGPILPGVERIPGLIQC